MLQFVLGKPHFLYLYPTILVIDQKQLGNIKRRESAKPYPTYLV